MDTYEVNVHGQVFEVQAPDLKTAATKAREVYGQTRSVVGQAKDVLTEEPAPGSYRDNPLARGVRSVGRAVLPESVPGLVGDVAAGAVGGPAARLGGSVLTKALYPALARIGTLGGSRAVEAAQLGENPLAAGGKTAGAVAALEATMPALGRVLNRIIAGKPSAQTIEEVQRIWSESPWRGSQGPMAPVYGVVADREGPVLAAGLGSPPVKYPPVTMNERTVRTAVPGRTPSPIQGPEQAAADVVGAENPEPTLIGTAAGATRGLAALERLLGLAARTGAVAQ